MRIIVCGDRNWIDYALILSTLREMHSISPITVVVEGEAKGADRLGRKAAESLGIPVEPHAANWARYGLGAGPIRNRGMLATKPDLVIAFHHSIESSKGTKNMVEIAQEAGIPVRVIK